MLRDTPENKDDLSSRMLENILQKAFIVRHFLYDMKEQDINKTQFINCGILEEEVATRLGNCHGVRTRTVYNYYRGWQGGEVD